MRLRVLVILTLCIFSFAGCAFLRGGATWLTDQHIANVHTAEEIALKICNVSDFQTGFIRASLGSSIVMLPQEAVSTLDEIDTMIKDCDCANLTSGQKGELLGLWIRFTTLGTLRIIEQFAPDVLDVIGIVL